jgi:hypothetical protein
VARAAAAGDEGLVVIDRRHFAVLAVLVVLVLALAGLLAWRAWGDPEQASLSEPIAVTATLAPDQHLFGDPVRARAELIIDSNRIDPDTVRLRTRFAPYRPLRPVERSETTAGNVTRLRFDYQLACLGYRCRPLGQRRFELRNATVEYRSRGRDAVQTE